MVVHILEVSPKAPVALGSGCDGSAAMTEQIGGVYAPLRRFGEEG